VDGGPGALRGVDGVLDESSPMKRPGRLLPPDPAAELDSGSVIALVFCVAVVPGRTKYVRTSCAGAIFRLCLSGAGPREALSIGVSDCKHANTGVNMDGSRAIVWIRWMV
jgi:hypothetical protein